jgi:hypothetical protein
MTTINDVIKINALLALLLGALLVFMPDAAISFLNEAQGIPKVVPLFVGVALNIFGLLQLWLAKNNPIPQLPLLLVVIVDFIAVVAIVVLIQFELWISSINGITAAGLIAIVIGWLAWIQLQHYLSNKI